MVGLKPPIGLRIPWLVGLLGWDPVKNNNTVAVASSSWFSGSGTGMTPKPSSIVDGHNPAPL